MTRLYLVLVLLACWVWSSPRGRLGVGLVLGFGLGVLACCR